MEKAPEISSRMNALNAEGAREAIYRYLNDYYKTGNPRQEVPDA